MSVYYRMNSQKVYQMTTTFEADKNVSNQVNDISQYVTGGNLYQDVKEGLSGGLDSRCFNELVTVSASGNVVTINVIYDSEDGASALLDTIDGAITARYGLQGKRLAGFTKALPAVATNKTSTDTSIAEAKANIEELETDIAGLTSSSVKKLALAGMVAGVGIAIFIIVMEYLISDVVKSQYELDNNLDICTIPLKEGEELALLRVKGRLEKKNAVNVVSLGVTSGAGKKLLDRLEVDGVEVRRYDVLPEDQDELRKLCGGVMLCGITLNESRYRELNRDKDICADVDCEMIGLVG